MNRENRTETPPSLTSSTVPTNNPLPHAPQATKSTWGSVDQPIKPTNVDPPQKLSSEAINDRRRRLPPVPLFQPADPEPPSKSE